MVVVHAATRMRAQAKPVAPELFFFFDGESRGGSSGSRLLFERAQLKQSVRFSLTASSISRTEPSSKTVASVKKAVIPPPRVVSPANAEEGLCRGSQAKQPLMTQITDPDELVALESKEVCSSPTPDRAGAKQAK